MAVAPFEYVVDDAGESPVALECRQDALLAAGGTAKVFKCALGVVKRIEDVVDVPHAQFKRSVRVNAKHVIDAEVALHARISALGIAYAPAFYGVVRLRTGSVEFRGRDVERWTYFIFMEYVAGDTLLEFLRDRRGTLVQQQADALVLSLKRACDAFARHGIVLDDRDNPANVLVQAGPTYRIVFVDFQCNRWHHRPPSDMFGGPAWLICVAVARTEHATGVLSRARCILSEVSIFKPETN